MEKDNKNKRTKTRSSEETKKRSRLKVIWLVFLTITIIPLALVFIGVSYLRPVVTLDETKLILGALSDFVTTPNEKIESADGKTNVLILGKGGEMHDAPDLTDTMIFASISRPASSELRGAGNDPSITLISLPRDIWVPEIRAKLNTTYYWGNQKPERYGSGIELSKITVEKIVGQPVHYVVVVDFESFERIIDVVEGIDVNVQTAFVDEKYPILGKETDECLPASAGEPAQADDGDEEFKCRYETIRFTKGKQLMDGETALKFVRSRNAEGDEGTDFARSARQRLVIEVLKNKLMKSEIFLNPVKTQTLVSVALENIEADMDLSAAAILGRKVLSANGTKIKSLTIPDEFLENPPTQQRYDFLYVFIPKADDPETPESEWDEVQEWFRGILSK